MNYPIFPKETEPREDDHSAWHWHKVGVDWDSVGEGTQND